MIIIINRSRQQQNDNLRFPAAGIVAGSELLVFLAIHMMFRGGCITDTVEGKHPVPLGIAHGGKMRLPTEHTGHRKGRPEHGSHRQMAWAVHGMPPCFPMNSSPVKGRFPL